LFREPALLREQGIAEKLARRYPPDRWALVPQVRSAQGGRVDGLRVADIVAVAFWPSDRGRVELVEIKVSASDLRRETLKKSAPFVSVAAACWIAVPAPWHRVVPSKRLLPEGWGLLSVGTGAPTVIVPAKEREPVERLSLFELALLHAAVATTGEWAGEPGLRGAPLIEVIRPFLSRGHVGLGCHHAAMSLAKTTPEKLPCLGCRDGRPTDPEAIEAAIADATEEQLARYAALCAARRVA
jgi:hypothetical protein